MKKEYIRPESKIMDITCEGVLCASGNDFNTVIPSGEHSSIQIWEEEDATWF